MNAYQLVALTVHPRNSGYRFLSSVVTILNAGKYSTTSRLCILFFKWKKNVFLFLPLFLPHTSIILL